MKVRASHAVLFALAAVGARVVAGLVAAALEDAPVDNAGGSSTENRSRNDALHDSETDEERDIPAIITRRTSGVARMLDLRAPVSLRAAHSRTECSVCLCMIKRNARQRSTICGHRFHARCLESWVFYASDKYINALRQGCTRLQAPCCPNCLTDLRVVPPPAMFAPPVPISIGLPEHLVLEDAAARAVLEAEFATARAVAFCPGGVPRGARHGRVVHAASSPTSVLLHWDQ